MKAKDLLISVNNICILDKGHEEVVRIIKTTQMDLELTIERGHDLPSMALLAKGNDDHKNQEKLPNYYLKTLQENPDYSRSCKESIKVFTTAGPPKICSDQYNKPIGLYSAETVARMADTVEVDSSLTGENVDRNTHFSPNLSMVLDMILEDDDKITSSGSTNSCVVQASDSTTDSRAASRADSIDGQGGSRRGSIIDKQKRGRYQSLTLPDILLENEEKERRGSRKLSLVLQGENNFLVDAKLAISEGRYGDLGFKTLL